MRSHLMKSAALILSVLMLLPCLAGCGFDEDYTGPILQVTLGDMPTTFDPAFAYNDETALQLLSLMYEGLFTYNASGKLVNGIAKSWKWTKQDAEKNEYVMEIKLKKTAWSDGQTVTADQFVYAWRRLLDPGMTSDAACLLYDIKNAETVKKGDLSIFAFGATAPNSDIIQLEFDHKIDTNQFFALLASPALVPQRDDIVGKNNLTDWASTSAIVVCNGPFFLKSYTMNSVMRLERNRNYYRNVEKDAMDKYVTPYRLEVAFGREYVISDLPLKGDETKQELVNPVDNLLADPKTGDILTSGDGITPFISKDKTSMTAAASYSFSSVYALNEYLWQSGETEYMSNIPLENREKYASSYEKTTAKNATATVLFNTKNDLLKDARVRRALSLAIDRAALAGQLRNVDPAKGLVFGAKGVGKQSYREAAGELLQSGAKQGEAKALLKEAGVNGGSFTIAIRYSDPVSVAVADYLIGVWNTLGFTVKTQAFAFTPSGDPTKADYKLYDMKEQGYDNLIEDYFNEAYAAGNFDAILLDYCQLTTDAFSTLAPFSTRFCGSSIDLSLSEEELNGLVSTHVSGYQSEAYDALLNTAFDEKSNTEARVKALADAEKLLLEDGIVAPLFTYNNSYITNGHLKGLKTDWFGSTVFTKVSDKTYTYEKAD